MKRTSKGLPITAAIVALAGVSLLAMLAALNRRDQIVGLNQEIQYDDFAFSVQDIRKWDAPAADALPANPEIVYYVVTIRIANHAKRVNYTFKKGSAILVDTTGREFHLSGAGQQALESSAGSRCSAPIPAGASCITDLVFELPANARAAQLRISEGGLAGDILDVVFYGKKRIEFGSLQ